MAADRFVHWRDVVPTHAQLHALLVDYFGDLVEELKFEHGRFFILLKSQDSFALRRQERVNDTSRDHAAYMTACSDQRALEVFVHEADGDERPSIDIITRHADELTNDLAHGLMRLCARLWNGYLDIDQTTWMREEARRCDGGERSKAADKSAERLLRTLRDMKLDGKAIDLLTQMVRCRTSASGEVPHSPDSRDSADLSSGSETETGPARKPSGNPTEGGDSGVRGGDG